MTKIILLVAMVGSVFARDLTCLCVDKSTDTIHRLSFQFVSETAVHVDLDVTEGSEAPEVVCKQHGDNFVLSKTQANQFQFTGHLKCPDQKIQEMEINFDASTMSLPNDKCNDTEAFHCDWNG